MKRHILNTALLLFLTSVFISCERERDNILIEQDNIIHARVENALEYSNVVEVKLMINTLIPLAQFYVDIEIARGTWKDCGFTIELPITINPNYLYSLLRDGRWNMRLSAYTYYESLTATTISNENAKTVNAEFWGVDENGHWIAPFSLVKIEDEYNFTRAVFTYVDSDVTIFGNNTERNDFGNPSFEIHNIYSIEWKKGWNVWYFTKSRTITNDGTPILTRQWSSIPVNGLKWYGEEAEWRL